MTNQLEIQHRDAEDLAHDAQDAEDLVHDDEDLPSHLLTHLLTYLSDPS